MPSNIVTAGLGHRLLSGGLGGNGLASGSVELIQNPSFETPGTLPGEAANWAVTIVSSAVEYAAFTRPGLFVVTDTVPATLGDLGITIVDNLDGTITLLEAADTQAAQDDFEAAWSNNDQYLFVFPGTALTDCFFGVVPIEAFENGWQNDPGELNIFDTIASAIASYSHRVNPSTLVVITDEFESFEGRWPASAPAYFINNTPDVVFGQTRYGNWKDPVAVATVVSGVFTTAFANGQVVDGYTLVTSDRILIKNQTAGSQNGIYIVNASGAPTRATDADTNSEITLASVNVLNGSDNVNSAWQCTTNLITLETTSLVFDQLIGLLTPYTQNPNGIITDTDLNGRLQYVDNLLVTVTDEIKDDLTITYTFLDKFDHTQTFGVIIPAHTKIGTTINGSPNVATGIRSLDTVVASTVMPGVIFHGDPGVLLDARGTELAGWERAAISIGLEAFGDYGLETFQVGWNDNQHYITVPEDGLVRVDAGFNVLEMGVYDLGTHVFSVGSGFSLPDYGKVIVGCVTALTGGVSTPNTLTITYYNQIGVVKVTDTIVLPGLPIGKTITIPFALGDVGVITLASVMSSTAQTGQIQFFGGNDIAEIFDNLQWPSPDPGL